MSYKAVGFYSLAELNQYFEDNPDDRPLTMGIGAADNSWVVIFDTTAGPPAEEEAVPEDPAAV